MSPARRRYRPSNDFADQPWNPAALCREVDPETFFADGRVAIKLAQRVCALCPVIAECRDWSIEQREEFGVWGGLSPKQRSKEIRKLEQGVA